MKNQIRLITFCCVAALSCAATHAQSDGDFAIVQAAIAGGGGTSSGGNFNLDGTAGQAIAGTRSTGGSFRASGGFFNNTQSTTAAAIDVSGRVVAFGTRGIKGAAVIITGLSNPNLRLQTLTNARGEYRFEELPAGEVYIITVSRKGYTFAPPSMVVSPTTSLIDVGFQGSIEQ